MVKPGGTGRPRLAISARLAPLPPSRSRRLAVPSALPSPKVKTHWPGFTTGLAWAFAMGLTVFADAFAAAFAAGFTGAFAAGLAGAFFSALRAAGAAFLAGTDGFDF